MGILYIVSTPIGNLQDMTWRAIKTLFEVDVIACEDTRRTGILLETMHIPYETFIRNEDHIHKGRPKLLSYFEHNELRRIPEILSFLHKGEHVALVSDAGTPAISDPGFKLIRECIRHGIKVEAIPGPSSVITSLVTSGLPTDKFLFIGYPPRKIGHRKKFFEQIKTAQEIVKSTVILFEAPHKLLTTLAEMKESFGDIEIVITRELTKMNEEILRFSITEAIIHFEKYAPKGEMIVLFNLSV